jgi:hypothetical protein
VNDHRKLDDDDKPRKGLLVSLPRGTFTRVLILLALLAGVIVLQRRAGAISGCMSQTFMLPAPTAVKTSADAGSSSGRIRAHVVVPEAGSK